MLTSLAELPCRPVVFPSPTSPLGATLLNDDGARDGVHARATRSAGQGTLHGTLQIGVGNGTHDGGLSRDQDRGNAVDPLVCRLHVLLQDHGSVAAFCKGRAESRGIESSRCSNARQDFGIADILRPTEER